MLIKRYCRAWNTLFSALVWTVWECRNNLIFNGKQASIPVAADMVVFRVVWWFKFVGNSVSDPVTLMLCNFPDSVSSNAKPKFASSQVCSPLFVEGLNFFVDGSSRGNPGPAGIGGVLRCDSGKFLGLFYSFIGFSDAVVAEATAILKACQLCYTSLALRLKSISIISDSKLMVSWVNGEEDCLPEVATIISEIRSFLALMSRVRVVFFSKIRNSVADFLAKKGSGLQEEALIWDYG